MVAQHTLLHRETLLVVSSSDASHSQPHDQTLPEDVALELVAQAIALHFLGDSLVHESTATPSRPIRRVLQLVLIIDVERLLRTQSGIADVELNSISIPGFQHRASQSLQNTKSVPSY